MSGKLRALQDVVGSDVLAEVAQVSEALRQLGIPHALVGGLAVGLHGHPRATKDVDFIVGREAFERVSPLLVYRDELRPLVARGVGKVDLIAAVDDPVLESALRRPSREGDVPVAPIEVLVKMKLDAGRSQDRADVGALVQQGANVRSIGRWLSSNAPEHVNEFRDIATRAVSRARGSNLRSRRGSGSEPSRDDEPDI